MFFSFGLAPCPAWPSSCVTMLLVTFVKPVAFTFRYIMAFISLCVCFFGSVEHIKCRSDLRDQFRSTLAGFGESKVSDKGFWRPLQPQLLCCCFIWACCLYSACLQRKLCCKHLPFHKDEALVIPPTINFIGRDFSVEFMTNYRMVCNHSLGSSHQIMSQF